MKGLLILRKVNSTVQVEHEKFFVLFYFITREGVDLSTNIGMRKRYLS